MAGCLNGGSCLLDKKGKRFPARANYHGVDKDAK